MQVVWDLVRAELSDPKNMISRFNTAGLCLSIPSDQTVVSSNLAGGARSGGETPLNPHRWGFKTAFLAVLFFMVQIGAVVV